VIDSDEGAQAEARSYLALQMAGYYPLTTDGKWGVEAINAPIECSLLDPWSLSWLIDRASSGGSRESYVLGRDALSSPRDPADMRLARRFLETAALDTDAARIHLAQDLAFGTCGAKKLATACAWLLLAAESSYRQVSAAAKVYLDLLEGRMSEEDKVEARSHLAILRKRVSLAILP
jgi:hypothetical protein